MSILTGDITKLELWGFEEGFWWEVGSGTWTQEGDALCGEPGHDPEWTWITSPHPFPAQFELTLEISGVAALAGIGFGVAKDFVVPKPAEPNPITMRFVIWREGTELFGNGKPATPAKEFQFNIDGVESLRTNRLQLKAFKQRGPVRFSKIFLKELGETG